MPRLIEVRPSVQDVPGELLLHVGDVLAFAATGGRLASGTCLQVVGVLTTSQLAPDGRVLSPAGAPDAVLFLAAAPGEADLEVHAGDPWGATRSFALHVVVRR